MGIQRNFSFLRSLAQRISSPARTQVLIVDPDLAGSGVLAAALPRNFAVAFAATAAEARAAIEKESPDLVVTELHLPDASGIDLISSLRQRTTTNQLLLMAVAAYASIGEKIAVFRAGADDCLIKPIEPEAFAKHVQLIVLSHATLRSDAS